MTENLPVPRPISPTRRLLRRIGIAIGGGVVVFLGVCMLVLPGPGILVTALGLGILSLEFEAPRRWLALAKARIASTTQRLRRRKPP